MFNSDFWVRVLIAVCVAVLALAGIPAVLRTIGFPTTPDILLIVRIVVAVAALFFIFKGKTTPTV